MLNDREKLSIANCERLRRKYPLRFLQVLPDPKFADNVQLRIGQGEWRTMHMTDAEAWLRPELRKQRKVAVMTRRTRALRRALDDIKQRHAALQVRERIWGDLFKDGQ